MCWTSWNHGFKNSFRKPDFVHHPTPNTVTPQPLATTTSRPDQPASHIPPVLAHDDPLPKVPCYGNQLSRVRMAGCKDLRAGNATARERLDHVYPFRIADWHAKCSFLKVSMYSFLIGLELVRFLMLTCFLEGGSFVRVLLERLQY